MDLNKNSTSLPTRAHYEKFFIAKYRQVLSSALNLTIGLISQKTSNMSTFLVIESLTLIKMGFEILIDPKTPELDLYYSRGVQIFSSPLKKAFRSKLCSTMIETDQNGQNGVAKLLIQGLGAIVGGFCDQPTKIFKKELLGLSLDLGLYVSHLIACSSVYRGSKKPEGSGGMEEDIRPSSTSREEFERLINIVHKLIEVRLQSSLSSP